MDEDIQLISDGAGFAVIGDPVTVERFLVSEGLPSSDLGLRRLGPALTGAAGLAQAGAEIATNSGRWVKLTEESAQAVKKYGLMKSRTTGLDLGVVQVKGQRGGIKGVVQFVKGSGLRPTNPALLAGVAGIMAQVAMQQSMKEITDYLARIEEKVDDVLHAQKDNVLADALGVDSVISEAMTIREHVGRVSDVAWSKVQSTSLTIARTEEYALRRLDALAAKVERNGRIAELARASKEAEAEVQEWLAVLAYCLNLQDAVAVLELDRVLDASPDELDRHRLGLQAARRNRRQLISRSTDNLVVRLGAAASDANGKVLLHPLPSRAVVDAFNRVAVAVGEFDALLGLEGQRRSLEARRWVDAAVEARDRVLQSGAEGAGAARQLGERTLDRTRSVTGQLSSGIGGRRLRRRDGNGQHDDGQHDDGQHDDEQHHHEQRDGEGDNGQL